MDACANDAVRSSPHPTGLFCVIGEYMTDDNWHQQETYKSLMLYGNNAVKFVLLVNGGAVIALLTFLGNLVKNNSVSIDMAWPMGCFLVGVMVGGLATITAYMTQLSLYNESIGNTLKREHTFWLYAACTCGYRDSALWSGINHGIVRN